MPLEPGRGSLWFMRCKARTPCRRVDDLPDRTPAGMQNGDGLGPSPLTLASSPVYGTAGNPVLLQASVAVDVGAPADVGHVMADALAP